LTELEQIKSLIREVPDFPEPGISFKDITTLLRDASGLKATVDALVGRYTGEQIDVVVGIESRGFVIGTPMALALGCGFVPIRKPGKLPSSTLSQEYTLEYGTDAVEIHEDAIGTGERVLMVDDLLATGGTMEASCQLVERLGGKIIGVGFIVELEFLNGRKRLHDFRVDSLVRY